jgi:hypothetical protein|tara:strand:- start:84 stop:443 length:360 start_codon:yes stop_codon:yes gene_type:complete
MNLTWTIDNMTTEGEHKYVRIIHYTVSGTDENNNTGSIKGAVGFKFRDGTEDDYIDFNNIDKETAISWIKKALTPVVLDDNGNETDIDAWSEVEQGIKIQIQEKIKENQTNLPSAITTP